MAAEMEMIPTQFFRGCIQLQKPFAEDSQSQSKRHACHFKKGETINQVPKSKSKIIIQNRTKHAMRITQNDITHHNDTRKVTKATHTTHTQYWTPQNLEQSSYKNKPTTWTTLCNQNLPQHQVQLQCPSRLQHKGPRFLRRRKYFPKQNNYNHRH
ncbi:hypothetical protein JTB14_019039 [Gonioctena quinquepunctata]|nr:hypothetical protein JTB14_019039 [Gonioctena quinquepunctata]